jgi:muconolactone delta-isomerase
MENEMYQYMVDFTMPTALSERFTNRIPEQRAVVNQYFADGKLVSYCVSLEKAKVWAVFNAETEEDVKSLIIALPLTRFMRFEICPLTFYNVLTAKVPKFSVN